MNMLVIMIPLSLMVIVGAGIAFFWAVNHDQFDDMQTPALLPMSDDLPRDTPPPPPSDLARRPDETG